MLEYFRICHACFFSINTHWAHSWIQNCRKYFQKCRTEIIQCSFAQEAKLVWITTKHRKKQLASTINTTAPYLVFHPPPPPPLISAHDLYIEAPVHPTTVFENVQPNELIPNRINSTLVLRSYRTENQLYLLTFFRNKIIQNCTILCSFLLSN